MGEGERVLIAPPDKFVDTALNNINELVREAQACGHTVKGIFFVGAQSTAGRGLIEVSRTLTPAGWCVTLTAAGTFEDEMSEVARRLEDIWGKQIYLNRCYLRFRISNGEPQHKGG